ncbi:MAG: NRDE family protein [Agriterribacter sp.]
MCTVTFIPNGDHFFITSNRDEHNTRKPALAPARYHTNGTEMLYPQDGTAKGSWITVKANGDAAVLLNGAFIKHIPAPSYRLSRGLIFLELAKAASPLGRFNNIALNGIEPFTIILFENKQLYECRWDGNEKHQKELDASKPHIWSSVTLYNEHVTRERKQWFEDFLRQEQMVSQESIVRFHRFTGGNDPANNLVMNRNGKLSTVSITSVAINGKDAVMQYVDIAGNTEHLQTIDLQQEQKPATQVKKNTAFKSFFIRLFNWEYWPFNVVYGPIIGYWLWLCVKARSFFFFNASNPLIKNGGFLLESKKEIYDLMPQEYYPLTVFCAANTTGNQALQALQAKGLSFPVIAKPDIGMRGLKVKKLHNATEVEQYAASSKVDFLLQAFVDYPNEVGIFYYRMPGENKGNISGIVGKEFLTVTGDGYATIETLLMKNDRHLLQLEALKKSQPGLLQKVLPAGEQKVLVPYGNHARGAKFINLTHLATEKLTSTIHRVCSAVPEFYFGRLDIKYSSWEDLCEGKNFSVIELNGAGSEPTHMYDPSQSIFFAWKEIIKHWKLLYTISSLNHKLKGIPYMTNKQGLAMLKGNKEHVKQLEQ